MKVEIFFLAVTAFPSCLIARAADIAAESKRANEFFDKCWDETVARHPVDESFYGIKTLVALKVRPGLARLLDPPLAFHCNRPVQYSF